MPEVEGVDTQAYFSDGFFEFTGLVVTHTSRTNGWHSCIKAMCLKDLGVLDVIFECILPYRFGCTVKHVLKPGV